MTDPFATVLGSGRGLGRERGCSTCDALDHASCSRGAWYGKWSDEEPCMIYRDADGEPHREDDLPAIEFDDGRRMWMKHGVEHRENGPAILDDEEGIEFWYLDGELHRENGPAVTEWFGPKKTECWFLHGKQVNEDGTTYVEPDAGTSLSHEKTVQIMKDVWSKPLPPRGNYVPVKFHRRVP